MIKSRKLFSIVFKTQNSDFYSHYSDFRNCNDLKNRSASDPVASIMMWKPWNERHDFYTQHRASALTFMSSFIFD